MRVDVLFVHPGGQSRIYGGLAEEFTAIDLPVWPALLASALRRREVSCAIYDSNVNGWDPVRGRRLLEEVDPGLAVLMVYGHHPSASTQTMPAALALARDLKSLRPDLPLALGGTHPSALPELTLREAPADVVIAGEGAAAIEGLARWRRGKAPLGSVPGIWFRDGEKAVFTGPAPLWRDLDAEAPGYAWDLLPPLASYRAHNWHCFQDFRDSRDGRGLDVRSPYASLYTSLGCPYDCDYCCINAIFGRPGIRFWSADRVVSWIDELARRGVRNLRLADELFVLSPARVEEICDRLIGLGRDLNIWAYARVDTVRPRLLGKMRKAGFRWLCLGIESGNAAVRKGVNKSIRADARKVAAAIRSAGIHLIGNFMFGLPEDSLATMEETFALAADLNCEYVNFYTVMAYPGSRLYSAAAAPPRWESFSQHSFEALPLPTRYLTPAQVLRFRDDAFSRYFRRPAHRDLIRRAFGPRVEAHLERMLALPLERRLLRAEPGV